MMKNILYKGLLSLAIIVFAGQTVASAAPPPSSELKALYYDNGFFADTGGSPGCSTATTVSSTLPGVIPPAYASLFTQAAAAYRINPQFLAALYLNEHSNTWLPFQGPWASSPVGASGPFQFMPGTWNAYRVDGNNDGKIDIQNMYDAAYSAANFVSKNGITAETPLGNLTTPFAPNTFVRFSAVYNWGSGNVQRKTNPQSPLSAAPEETENYMTNTYELISSGFTRGSVKNGVPEDKSGGSAGAVTTAAPGAPVAADGCSPGVVSGSIVDTAVSLAWDTKGHGPYEADAKPTYKEAMPRFNGAKHTFPYSDCGVYVSTVMIASGADPQYPKRSTDVQLEYLKKSPKYKEINTKNTADLLPGDIFVNNSHTYLYVGKQPKGHHILAASLYDHVPEAGRGAYFYQNGNTGQAFRIFRLVGQT